ncbi:MAG: peptidoglycan-binding protein [Hyphomicrobiales bacterium]|nr:peptidoglycan-binding protein [Hyphomicrobiales bacterium]
MAEHSQRSAHVAGLTSTARAPNNDKPSRTTAVQRSTVTARQEAGKADGGKKGVRQPGPARDLIGSLIRGEKYSTPRPPRDIPARNRSEPGNLRSAATVKDKQRIVSMQRALVKLGYPLTVDGIAGPATKAALEKFQRNNRLPASGRPGGRTLQVLASRARVPIP